MLTRRITLLPIAAAILLASAAAFSACGDDGDDASGASSSHSALISAITFLDNAGLHDIDVAINEEQSVPADARTVMLRGATVLRLAEWPEDMASSAETLADTMQELAEVLNGDPIDTAKAGELAAKVHDDEHSLSHDVWAHLQSEAGIESAGDSHD